MREPSLKKRFVLKPTGRKKAEVIFQGQDNISGRRQIVAGVESEVFGEFPDGTPFHGIKIPGGIDNQVIRMDGTTEMLAQYGIRLDSGAAFFVENRGIRKVPPEYVEKVLRGELVDGSLQYFVTTPKFEVYDPSLNWLNDRLYIAVGNRTEHGSIITYYSVELS